MPSIDADDLDDFAIQFEVEKPESSHSDFAKIESTARKVIPVIRSRLKKLKEDLMNQ